MKCETLSCPNSPTVMRIQFTKSALDGAWCESCADRLRGDVAGVMGMVAAAKSLEARLEAVN